MKLMKGFLVTALLLGMLMALCVPVLAQTEEAAGEGGHGQVSTEVVLLFDVSGSMNKADPDKAGSRLSIEAAQNLAFNASKQFDLILKVIPYTHQVYTGFPGVNVSPEGNEELHKETMQKIYGAQVPGMECWTQNTYTNMGLALSEACKALESSECEKKAVVLFTDGKIDLAEGPEAEAQATGLAMESAAALKEKGIELYSIGLDADGKGNVDRGFFAKLHGVGKVEESDHILIVEDASDLGGSFTRMFADLLGQKFIDPDEPMEIGNDGDTVEKVLHVYGGATKQVNLSITGSARLHTVKVRDPKGETVCDIELKEGGKAELRNSLCAVDYTFAGRSVTVKLFDPAGGDWTVSVSGDKGTVIHQLFTYKEVGAGDSLKTDRLYIGDSLDFEVKLYNGEGKHLREEELYSPQHGASATLTVLNKNNTIVKRVDGVLNEEKNGYDFHTEFSSAGDYTLKVLVRHNVFEEELTKKLAVLAPVLELSGEAVDKDGSYQLPLKIRFVDPLTQKSGRIPAYIADAALQLVIRGEEGEEILPLDMTKFENGEFTYTYLPKGMGEYHAYVTTKGFAQELCSRELSLRLSQRPLQVSDFPTELVERSVLSGGIEERIDFTGRFTDVEGDPLSYQVTVEGDEGLQAVLEGTVLVIKTRGAAQGTVTVLAADGKGSEGSKQIRVNVTSTLPLLIALIVIVLIAAAAAVLLILILRKKSVISMAFRVKVEKNNDWMGSPEEAVFDIPNLSGRRNTKAKMSLKELLGLSTLHSQVRNTVKESDWDSFLQSYAELFVLGGVPFKNQIRLELLSSGGSKPVRSFVFSSSELSVSTSDGLYTVSIGNGFAFGDGGFGY